MALSPFNEIFDKNARSHHKLSCRSVPFGNNALAQFFQVLLDFLCIQCEVREFQYTPVARSFDGRISKHVVHHPVRMVSINSAGRLSSAISAARDSWSYGTGAKSTCRLSSTVRSVDQTFVLPSFSGRPMTPTLTTWRPLGNGRCHLIPVCVTRIISAR